MKRQQMILWAWVTGFFLLVSPTFADQVLINEDFSDISDWKDLSKAVTWSSYTTPVSAITVAGGYASLTTEAKSFSGYTTENQLKTFTAIDYQFPVTVDHNTSTLQIDYRARWGSGTSSGEGSRFMIVLNHDYTSGGLDMDLNDKYNDFDAEWWARPAYQVRMRGPNATTIMQYGGGLDPLGEYEAYKINNVPAWWLAGFISSPGGLSPNAGVPGCVVTGSSLFTTAWKNFRYVVTPTQQEIWADDNGNGVFESGERKAVQDLTADAANPSYFHYFDNLNGVRLYWRGASASQVELDQLTVTQIGGVTPQPPAAPSNLTATAVSTSQINLTWTDNASNESGFKIERKTGAEAFAEIATVGANVTSYSNTGLPFSATFTYRVLAYNGDGNSAYSNEASATTQTPLNPPAAPTSLAAAAVSTSQINLTWTDNASNESGFKIERKTGAEAFAEIATVGANVTAYSNSGLASSTAYTYRVLAYNADGNSAYSDEAGATTQTPLNPPAAPTSLAAGAIAPDQINLAWSDNANNETGFRIERKNGGGSFAQIATVGANVTSYSNTGLTASTAYTYRVLAYNADGNSAYSNEATATTPALPNPPAAPSNLTATAVSTSQINLVWTDNASNESGFKIERKTGAGAYGLVATLGVSVTSFNDTGLTPSTAYTYRVYAYNADGASAYSNEATAITQTPPSGIGIFAVTQDIGAVAAAGSATEASGVYTVKGSGADIWGSLDEFRYLYRDHSGDGEIIARVTSVQNTNSWAKAGVMFRDGTAANAKYAFVLQAPNKQVCFQYRTSTGGSAGGTSLTGGTTAVKWVRLVRSGNTFAAYYSTSSATGPWTKIGSTMTITMTTVKAGLAVTSHKDGTLCTATFDQVNVIGGLAKGDAEETMETAAAQVPEKFELKQNYPNPFNPQTTIEFNLPKDERVTLEIYDIRGRLVQRLVDDHTPAGAYAMIWDGLDEHGLQVSSGTYIYRMIAGKYMETRKMTLVR